MTWMLLQQKSWGHLVSASVMLPIAQARQA
jgi:hypothetical protein